MKPSVTGWKVAKSVSKSKPKLTDNEYSFKRAQNNLSTIYIEQASSKREKKSIIAQLLYHAYSEIV